MKIVGMIPARLGSKRVAKKNLRMLQGKPLIAYIIEAAQKSGVFDEIYINSESDIFCEIAQEYGVAFYKRSVHLSSDQAINDEFAYDFVEHVPGDVLVQLLPTSPLITGAEIADFVCTMTRGNYDTLVSVVNHQIACVYEGCGINFDAMTPHKSSQTMSPVQSYATVLMAWTYDSFMRNMKKYSCAYHGCDGKIGYYPLKGLSTIDIDDEEDFVLAEVAMKARETGEIGLKQYYETKNKGSFVAEVMVPQILKKDGVMHADFSQENIPLCNLQDIIAGKDNSKSWCHRIVNTENNSATLISQLPGEGNRRHYHPNWNEWWYIVQGQWEWEIEGNKMIVTKGDVVFIEKNKFHCITAIGDEPAVRLAVSKDLVPHVYLQD